MSIYDLLLELIDKYKIEQQEIMEAWADGSFTSESSEGTVQLNAKMIGKVQMLNDVLDDLETKLRELLNEKSSSA